MSRCHQNRQVPGSGFDDALWGPGLRVHAPPEEGGGIYFVNRHLGLFFGVGPFWGSTGKSGLSSLAQMSFGDPTLGVCFP